MENAVRYLLDRGEIYLNKSDLINLIHYQMAAKPGDERDEALFELISKLETPSSLDRSTEIAS